MCDMDCGSDGFDMGSDSDVGEGIELSSDSDIDVESSFEGLDDVDSCDDYSETMESFDADIEMESALAEEIGEVEYEEAEMDFSQLEDVEPELMISTEYLEELEAQNTDNPNFTSRINELIESGRLVVEDTVETTDEIPTEESDVKVLTREITQEVVESRERDTEEVLDNYRGNLQDRGVSEERIEEFINQERDKINAEYESLDRGDLSSNIYQEPTDWEAVADSLSEPDLADGEADAEIQESNNVSEFESEVDIDTENILDLEVSETPEMMSLADLPDIDEDSEMIESFTDIEENVTSIEEELPLEETDAISESLEVEEISAESQMEDNIESVIDYEEVEADFDDVSVDEITESSMTNNEMQELSINYDEIYEEIEQEALEQGFEDIDIYADAERLDNALENFEESNWEELSLEGQKESLSNLAEYVEETIGFKNPPQIEYYNNPREGDYGGYNAATNTLSVNEYMLYNSNEAADTIAHELWHAHQRECAENPQSARDYQYQYNFENYITPELGHEAYENQLIEAEARAFAAQFKGRLASISGRSR